MSIKCENISKIYHPKKALEVSALNGIDLNIASGEVYGVLGQNGAGKTTLIQILSTQLNPSAGKATVLGLDLKKNVRELRRRINVIYGGESGLYPWLTPVEMLEYFGYLYKLPNAQVKSKTTELLKLVELQEDLWSRPTMTLSKGQKQRLMIAKGLINDPDVIFLDEPTIGLDVKAVKQTRALILEWARQGKTVIITSHNMRDIETTCSRLCIIKNGIIMAEKSLRDLRDNYKNIVSISLSGSWDNISHGFLELGACHQIETKNGIVNFKLAISSQRMGELYNYFSSLSEQLLHLDVKTESLEDVYLEMIESKEGS